jgi:hypothetical protein
LGPEIILYKVVGDGGLHTKTKCVTAASAIAFIFSGLMVAGAGITYVQYGTRIGIREIVAVLETSHAKENNMAGYQQTTRVQRKGTQIKSHIEATPRRNRQQRTIHRR